MSPVGNPLQFGRLSLLQVGTVYHQGIFLFVIALKAAKVLLHGLRGVVIALFLVAIAGLLIDQFLALRAVERVFVAVVSPLLGRLVPVVASRQLMSQGILERLDDPDSVKEDLLS